MKVEISVIIPVYNTEQYLKDCLESVIAQQFEGWECLLINDGSTDNSGNICDTYTSRDSRFKTIHISNSGVSVARNLGIKNALGTYIAFLDSDDTVDDKYLSHLHDSMLQSKVELTVCGMKLMRPSGTEINVATQRFITIGSEDADFFVELNSKSLLYGPFVKLYHSDIIRKNKIYFPLGIQYGEDLIFNFEYLKYVTNIFVIDSPDYNYRILREGALSSSAHSRNFENNHRHWKIIRNFFNSRQINSLSAQVYLSNRLWGIAYDLLMNNRISIKELKNIFCTDFINDLVSYNKYTIVIPKWLKEIISNQLYSLMWLIQRRFKQNNEVKII